MTIWTLIGIFAIAGVFLTWLTRAAQVKGDLLTSFLQHFCGVWFFVSGAVKAIDPTGTAFKMEQYFAEFQSTFAGTWMKPLAGVFPWLSSHSLGFAICMIVLELLLGVMLMLGFRRKLTAWLFFGVLVFFTILTGFTFLTGYVPTEHNFFDFSKWGRFAKENMRVTDCGCFGDFLKLDPRVSFIKDLFLLIPGVYFLLRWPKMHQIGNRISRGALWLVTLVASGAFSFYYTFFAEPAVDFRPFREGVNVRTQREAEFKAKAEQQILKMVLENKESGKTITVSNDEYLKVYAAQKDTWKAIDQIKSPLAVPSTKISEFYVYDIDENDVTEELLNNPNTSVWVLMYKVPGHQSGTKTITVTDTIATGQVTQVQETSSKNNAQVVVPAGLQIVTTQKQVPVWQFEPAWYNRLKTGIDPLVVQANKAGVQVFVITPNIDANERSALLEQLKGQYTFLQADDILLKTIMRSNPGIVVVNNGQIIKKHHFNHLPGESKWLSLLK